MSVCFRVIMILACAYAGWEIASLQFEDLPEPQQQTQKSSSHSQ